MANELQKEPAEMGFFIGEDVSRALSQAILLASLFGSGKRDARSCSVQEDFVANRGGVNIRYVEASGSCYITGEVEVSDGKGLVLFAKRSFEEGAIVEAGIMHDELLSYRVETYHPERVSSAFRDFCKGLEPIGREGDIIQLDRSFVVR